MTLKELQGMIKEEFDSYMGEAEDDVDVSVNPDSDVDAEMGDDMGDMDAAGEEDVLRKIYDLLSMHFDGGEEKMDDEMPDMGDEEGDDMGEMSMDENSTTSAQYQKTGMAAGGAGKGGTGYDGKAGKGGTGYDAGSKALQERFKKLANIIK
jgi:hypothetical protein